MPKKSAGLLLFRFKNNILELMLVHPGGPYWKNKDAGAWSIPKGEFDAGEDPLTAAKRELKEETGIVVEGDFIELTPAVQKSGKMVYAWAIHADPDITNMISNTCLVEWPPRSGKQIEIPEVNKVDWFPTQVAVEKINKGQVPIIIEFLSRLEQS